MAGNKTRTLSAITAGMFLIALAIGIIAYKATETGGITIIIWVLALVFGLMLCMISTAYSDKEIKGVPSEMMYRFAVGSFVALIGLSGILWTLTKLDSMYILAIFIIGLAAIGISVALINSKKVEE